MYPASVIAYAFVKKGIDEGNPVTQMKLQKLIYFANGIYLAEQPTDTPLVKESFLAWEYGPVIPDIYKEYKIYGSSPIDDMDRWLLFNAPKLNEIQSTQLTIEANKAINTTWDALKDIDAISLSTWTHKTGSPWERYYKNRIIPTNEIRDYFIQEFVTPDEQPTA